MIVFQERLLHLTLLNYMHVLAFPQLHPMLPSENCLFLLS